MHSEEFHEVRAANALRRIANGEMPSAFCSQGNPSVPTNPASIELWASSNPEYAKQLIEAKLIGAKVMLAECIAIADNPSMKADQKKVAIDARKYLAAIWNAECNPKTVVEQTTVRSLTPREEFISQCINLLGMSREQAAARYAVETGVTVQ